MAADGANLGGFGDVSAFDLPADIPPFQTPEALEAVPGNVKLTGNFNLMAELFNYGSRHLSQDDRARRESLMNYDMESGALKVYLAGVTPSAIEAAKTMSEVFSAGYTVCTLPSELAYAFKFYKMAWPPAQVDPATAATVRGIEAAVAAALLGAADGTRVVGYGPNGAVMEAGHLPAVGPNLAAAPPHAVADPLHAGGHGPPGRRRRRGQRLRSCGEAL